MTVIVEEDQINPQRILVDGAEVLDKVFAGLFERAFYAYALLSITRLQLLLDSPVDVLALY